MSRLVLVLALAVSASSAQGQDGAVGGPGQKGSTLPQPAAIRVAFKLDSRLTTGLYMGERWVSPPTYSASGAGASVTVDVRASGLDAIGRPARISAVWTSSDPAMVSVTPGEGNVVSINVQRPGESTVTVASHGMTRQLAVKAVRQDAVMRVEIAQR